MIDEVYLKKKKKRKKMRRRKCNITFKQPMHLVDMLSEQIMVYHENGKAKHRRELVLSAKTLVIRTLCADLGNAEVWICLILRYKRCDLNRAMFVSI